MALLLRSGFPMVRAGAWHVVVPVFCWLLSHIFFNLENNAVKPRRYFYNIFRTANEYFGSSWAAPLQCWGLISGWCDLFFETLLSQHWRGGTNNHPCQINMSVRKILTRVVREFVGKGFRVQTLCKNVGAHVCENSSFNIKGAPPSKIPNLYIFLNNIGQAWPRQI